MIVKIFNSSKNNIPMYETPYSAGVDVRCDFENQGGRIIEEGNNRILILEPGERIMIHTGLYMEIPIGYECQVRSRSGLALKKGISIVNSPGTIDADYRGECNVILINHGNKQVKIEDGERIAQFVFTEVEQVIFEEVKSIEELSDTKRGKGGFGSTGHK